jgi:3-oxoacyl-[acyl-carrier protein] reductase
MSAVCLTDKGFVVIGGCHGIGPAVAIAGAEQGARVVFCERPGAEQTGEQVIAAARAAGLAQQVSVIPANNVSDEAGVERCFDLVLEQLPEFHILVIITANPMMGESKPLLEISLAEWNEVLAARLREPFLLSRRAIEEFLGGGGRIVHVTPKVTDGARHQASYAAAELALHALTRSIAKEYGRCGITCNTVVIRANPGTETTISIRNSGEQCGQNWLEAVTEAVLFLVSDEASFVNGEVLYMAGPAREERKGIIR